MQDLVAADGALLEGRLALSAVDSCQQSAQEMDASRRTPPTPSGPYGMPAAAETIQIPGEMLRQ